MKRASIVHAARNLDQGERAWVCKAIAVNISTGKDLGAQQNLVIDQRNEVVDALDACASGAQFTDAASHVFAAYLRVRAEWLQGLDPPSRHRRTWRPTATNRADWRDARRVCLELLCDLCPEAGEYLLNAEAQVGKAVECEACNGVGVYRKRQRPLVTEIASCLACRGRGYVSVGPATPH